MLPVPSSRWALVVVLASTACSDDGPSLGGAGGSSTAGSAGASMANGGSAGTPSGSSGDTSRGGAQSGAGTANDGGTTAGHEGGTSAGHDSGDSAGHDGGGTAGRDGGGAAGHDGTSGSGGGTADASAKFSFFVTSMQAIATLSGTDIHQPEGFGFGGDLRFGKADGLSGADEICRQAAELGVPGAGRKQWRAFLSVVGPPAVNARDRIGTGPWYDARGRLVAENLADLLDEARPRGDPAIANDLPNERGEPNHYVGPDGYTPTTTWDNHDTLTGSDTSGTLGGAGKSDTCNDWTSSLGVRSEGPRVGHSWPRNAPIGRGAGWASDHRAPGCARGYAFDDSNLPADGFCVGCAGGYGAIYCFAVTPSPT